MNILTKIKSDHQEIRRLIEAASNKPGQGKLRAYVQLKEWVLIHHNTEQDILLTELVKHEKARNTALHLVEEHGEHKMLIDLMEEMNPEDDDWESKFEKLSHELIHHMEEEEKDLFNIIVEVFDDESMRRIGNKMVLESAKLNTAPEN